MVEFPLRKFNVYQILGKSKKSVIEKGKAIYIIDIPDSENAPHQAFDKKYYARIGGTSKPINHKFVTDIIGRRKDPIMDLEFRLELKEDGGFIENAKLIVDSRNNGRVFAKYINCFLVIPKWLKPEITMI